MNPKRIKHLLVGNQAKTKGYVIYCLQQAARVEYNHALQLSIELANANQVPLFVLFGLTSNYPYGNQRHYRFMLEGLKEVNQELKKRHIPFVIRSGSIDQVVAPFLQDTSIIVIDSGHTRIQRAWRKNIYRSILENHPEIDLYQVETDLIVPVDVASDKEEYGAYTIRPKLNRLIAEFIDNPVIPTYHQNQEITIHSDFHLDNIDEVMKQLTFPVFVPDSPLYKGGYQEAKIRLNDFIINQLSRYEESNDPSLDLTSKMSMYLHFGQISALEIYEKVGASPQPESAKSAFIEQLFVRRELAFNFVHYNQDYDQFSKMTEPWAYQTMRLHEKDVRETCYSRSDYTQFQTKDPYFNSAMKEMIWTGYMHNYMRMYWAKKIIEWSKTYQEAYETIQFLNDTYFLDGRDPSSYAGIAWCFGKHDRAWTERTIFGKLRYMNLAGLERKFDIQNYVQRIEKYKP